MTSVPVKKAIVLLSGGLDSTTVLYYARAKGYKIIAMTFFYGQRHRREILSAKKIAKSIAVHHFIQKVDFPWGGSSLTDKQKTLPRGRNESEMKKSIPSTYVPARNTIFLSLAAGCADVFGADAIFIGANAIDYSGYPDCRPKYLQAFEKMIRLGTKAGVEGKKLKIEAPLLKLSKVQIVRMAKTLGVPFNETWSCYAGGRKPCGQCDSCILRQKGFEGAGLIDPSLKFK